MAQGVLCALVSAAPHPEPRIWEDCTGGTEPLEAPPLYMGAEAVRPRGLSRAAGQALPCNQAYRAQLWEADVTPGGSGFQKPVGQQMEQTTRGPGDPASGVTPVTLGLCSLWATSPQSWTVTTSGWKGGQVSLQENGGRKDTVIAVLGKCVPPCHVSAPRLLVLAGEMGRFLGALSACLLFTSLEWRHFLPPSPAPPNTHKFYKRTVESC